MCGAQSFFLFRYARHFSFLIRCLEEIFLGPAHFLIKIMFEDLEENETFNLALKKRSRFFLYNLK